MPEEDNGKKKFYRQAVLIPEIEAAQKNCDHTLVLINSTTIHCPNCGALWIR